MNSLKLLLTKTRYYLLESDSFKEGMLFFSGFFIGALLFILTYGTRVIDFTYDNWIFSLHDPDIRQHYVGWCAYRVSPWFFPPGLADNLSHPFQMSVLWSDSIPLFACFFKLFSGLLPETFQYLGFFGFLSFSLTGGFFALLTFSLTKNPYLSICACFPLTLNYPMLQRMFYHTSLTAQWIIVLPLWLWLSSDENATHISDAEAAADPAASKYLKKHSNKSLLWALLGFSSITIHPYLWAVAAAILIIKEAERLLQDYSATRCGKPRPHSFAHLKTTLLSPLLNLLVFASSSFAGLYLEGALEGQVSAAYGLGGFSSNLNSFFNPHEFKALLPSLPLFHEQQYEGFCYLGVGMLIFIALSALVSLKARTKSSFLNFAFRDSSEIASCPPLSRKRICLLIGTALFFIILSAFPNLTFNGRLILHIPYPGFLNKLLGIFRSNGRFIWISAFIIESLAIYAVNRHLKETFAVLLLSLCAFIQLYELSPNLYELRKTTTEEYSDPSREFDLNNNRLISVIDNYDRIVEDEIDMMEMQKIAFFAVKHGLTVNRYYFARDIDSLINENFKKEHEKVKSGNPDHRTIYVINSPSIREWKSYGMYVYDLTGTFIAVADPIPGLQTAYSETAKIKNPK